MKTLQRKPGSGFKSIGRTKKRDDSDISSIIDELNQEEKEKLLKIELKINVTKEIKIVLIHIRKLDKKWN